MREIFRLSLSNIIHSRRLYPAYFAQEKNRLGISFRGVSSCVYYNTSHLYNLRLTRVWLQTCTTCAWSNVSPCVSGIYMVWCCTISLTALIFWFSASTTSAHQHTRTHTRAVGELPFFFDHHFHFPAQLVGCFTLSDLLDKPCSQVSSLLPPGTCLQFFSRIGFSIPTARRFSSNVADSRSRAFR